MNELDTLFPGREIAVGGLSLTLQPFTFGQLPKATKLLKPVVSTLSDVGMFGVDAGAPGESRFLLAPDWPLKIVDAMAEGGDALLEFLAFAAGQPRSWFDTLPADDGIALAQAVFEINADFFSRRVLPKLGLLPSDGATSLPSSSQQGTDAATSTATPSDSSSSTPQPSSETAAG